MDEETIENLEEFQISPDVIERLKDPEVLRRYMEEGKTFQEIIGYSQETMEKFYNAAYSLFQQRHYKDAADGFTFLTTLNPYVHNYWLGLGMSEQLIEDYEAALVAYAMAIMTDLETPIPHYHSATCYNLLGDKESAIMALKLSLERASASDAFSAFKTLASDALKRSKDKPTI